MKPFTTAAFAALAVSPGAYAQNFITNCSWQTAMLVDGYLGAYCNNDNWLTYSYDWSWFDTSNCLMNYNGQLVSYEGGNYSDTCKGCSVSRSHADFVLNCYCLQPGFTLGTATYDLNQIIWNHNGFLGCFEQFGNKSERGPF
ncbi:hypothetical protein F4861DRAFT_525202 [Xylaria intraflava]|nr:hypothetical protein F4861DRAFT_525202 [Xylaria intraflava]